MRQGTSGNISARNQAHAGLRATRRRNPTLFAIATLALSAFVALAATAELGFSRGVTPGLIKHLAALFGDTSRSRIGAWQEFIRPLSAGQPQSPPRKSERDLLDSVNAFFNRTPFVSDSAHWGVEDYWATPAEMLASNGADCEDFSIAKYFALKELGIPIERLRITYVKAVRLDQAHMVLAYYATPGAEPLILDNIEVRVRSAGERSDLIPVYSFNDEDLLLVRPDPSGRTRGNPSQIRLWSALLAKLERELRY